MIDDQYAKHARERLADVRASILRLAATMVESRKAVERVDLAIKESEAAQKQRRNG